MLRASLLLKQEQTSPVELLRHGVFTPLKVDLSKAAEHGSHIKVFWSHYLFDDVDRTPAERFCQLVPALLSIHIAHVVQHIGDKEMVRTQCLFSYSESFLKQ